MSTMIRFPKYTVVLSHVRVTIDLTDREDSFNRAQEWFGQRVLQDCRAYIPHLTGSQQQRSHTEDGGRKVVFPGPYARYLYGGKVMVDSETGKGPRKIPTGPNEYILRFRKGARLKPTDRKLKYSNPEARDHWFEAAKAEHADQWVEELKRQLGET